MMRATFTDPSQRAGVLGANPFLMEHSAGSGGWKRPLLTALNIASKSGEVLHI